MNPVAIKTNPRFRSFLASAEIALLSILEIIFGTLSVWIFIGERPSHASLIGGGVVYATKINNAAVAGAAFAVIYNYPTNVGSDGGDQLTSAMGGTERAH